MRNLTTRIFTLEQSAPAPQEPYRESIAETQQWIAEILGEAEQKAAHEATLPKTEVLAMRRQALAELDAEASSDSAAGLRVTELVRKHLEDEIRELESAIGA